MNAKVTIGGLLAAGGLVAALAIATRGGSKPVEAPEQEVEALKGQAQVATEQPALEVAVAAEAAPAERPREERRWARGDGNWDNMSREDWERRRQEWEAQMTPEQREQMRQRWEGMRARMEARMDKNGDGVVSDDERREFREEQRAEQAERMAELKRQAEEIWGGPMPLSDREMMMTTRMLMEQSNVNMREIWRGMDTDGDGEVSEAEGEAARQNFEQQLLRMQEDLFVKYDSDQDGTMNDAEREAAAAQMRSELEDWGVMRRVDTNRDGQVDDGEVLNFTSRFDGGERVTDLNRDGVVDDSDYERFLDLMKKK